jgi:hypothetical protein
VSRTSRRRRVRLKSAVGPERGLRASGRCRGLCCRTTCYLRGTSPRERVSFMAAPRQVGAWCVSARGQVGAIKWTTTPGAWGSEKQPRSRLSALGDGSRRGVGLFEAADVTVSEPVVDEDDHLAGDGGLGDLTVVPPLCDPFSFVAQPRLGAEFLGGFDHGPADQSGTLLICGPRGDQGSGWSVRCCVGRARPCPMACRAVSRAVKAGPQARPEGAALTARTPAASTMNEEARQGFLGAWCWLCGTSFRGMWSRRMRASLLISALGVANGVGCKMAFGVSRRKWCGRSFLVGCPARLAATGLRGAGRRSSAGGRALPPTGGGVVVRRRWRTPRRRRCAACGNSGARACGPR